MLGCIWALECPLHSASPALLASVCIPGHDFQARHYVIAPECISSPQLFSKLRIHTFVHDPHRIWLFSPNSMHPWSSTSRCSDRKPRDASWFSLPLAAAHCARSFSGICDVTLFCLSHSSHQPHRSHCPLSTAALQWPSHWFPSDPLL